MLRMSRPSITLPDQVAEPAFCENRDDFYKMVISMARVWADDNREELEFVTFGVRLLLHEYLALVCSGKMKPYILDPAFKENELEGFKEMINHSNQWLTSLGVPMREGENGKVEFDYGAIDEVIRRRDGKA